MNLSFCTKETKKTSVLVKQMAHLDGNQRNELLGLRHIIAVIWLVSRALMLATL
jgi:hypothetical protein